VPPPLAARLRLLLLTDRSLAAPRELPEVVAAALRGGVTAVQLREKEWGVRETLPLARILRTLTWEAGALFFLNDRIDLALAVGADGAHLGPQDLPLAAARSIVPPTFLLGYSTDLPEQAMEAEQEGADYLGCGAVWPTTSKADAGEAIGPAGVGAVASAVGIPVVAIGGITLDRVSLLRGTGAAGVAVMGAILASSDPEAASRALIDAQAG